VGVRGTGCRVQDIRTSGFIATKRYRRLKENLDTDSFDKHPSGLSLRVEDRTGNTGFLQQVQDR